MSLHDQAEAYRQAEARAMYEEVWGSKPDTGDWLDDHPLLCALIAVAVLATTVALSGYFPLPWWGPQ